jgi:hypothetical protein
LKKISHVIVLCAKKTLSGKAMIFILSVVGFTIGVVVMVSWWDENAGHRRFDFVAARAALSRLWRCQRTSRRKNVVVSALSAQVDKNS